ncbi:MAG: sarcosine oxidase subunit gamma [Kiloniellales bacterium]
MSDLRSPLEGHLKPGRLGKPDGEAGVTLAERPVASLVQVAAWPDSAASVAQRLASLVGSSLALGRPGTTARGEDGIIMTLAPGRFLVESKAAGFEAIVAAAIPAEAAAVTDLTHGRSCVTIEGPAATWVLAKGMGLDFELSAFPVGRVALGAIHEMGVTLRRDSEQAFALYVFRSFALSSFEWLTDAALETGCRLEANPGK